MNTLKKLFIAICTLTFSLNVLAIDLSTECSVFYNGNPNFGMQSSAKMRSDVQTWIATWKTDQINTKADMVKINKELKKLKKFELTGLIDALYASGMGEQQQISREAQVLNVEIEALKRNIPLAYAQRKLIVQQAINNGLRCNAAILAREKN